MNSILESFGFNPMLFLAQIVNFLLLAFVFQRFLYKPLLSVIKNREEKIHKGLLDSDQAKKLLEETETRKKEILRETQKESDSIIENARSLASEIREKSLIQAKADTEKLLSEAKLQANLEMEKMQREIKNMSLDASEAILKKIVSTTLTKEEQEKFLAKAKQEMKKN
jgi:F-type H+-transporting ATPase subunit b